MVVIIIAIVMLSPFRNNSLFLLKIIHQTLETVLVLFCCRESTLEVPNAWCWSCEFPYVISSFDTEALNHRTHSFKDPVAVEKNVSAWKDSHREVQIEVFRLKYDNEVMEAQV